MSETQSNPELEKTVPESAVASAVADGLLSTENLAKEYHGRRVVNGVSIAVSAGEIGRAQSQVASAHVLRVGANPNVDFRKLKPGTPITIPTSPLAPMPRP